MILAPLVPAKAFTDHCDDCGRNTDWFLDFCKVDFKTNTITQNFHCGSCQESHKNSGWKRVSVSTFEVLKLPK